MRKRFSAPVQNGPGAHPSSCTMGTGSFPEVKSGRGVTLTPHPLLVPWSWKGRAIPPLPLWAVRPVQSLSACTRVTFTFTFKFRQRRNKTTDRHTDRQTFLRRACLFIGRNIWNSSCRKWCNPPAAVRSHCGISLMIEELHSYVQTAGTLNSSVAVLNIPIIPRENVEVLIDFKPRL